MLPDLDVEILEQSMQELVKDARGSTGTCRYANDEYSPEGRLCRFWLRKSALIHGYDFGPRRCQASVVFSSAGNLFAVSSLALEYRKTGAGYPKVTLDRMAGYR